MVGAAGAATLLSLWPELKRLLAGRAIVAHGHGTEKRFLRAFPGHPFGPWIDTLLRSRAAWPDFDDHSLGNICDQLGLSARVEKLAPEGRWHDALFDSVASLAILKHLVSAHDLADRDLDLLLNPDLSAYQRRRG